MNLAYIDPSLLLNIPVLVFVFAFGCCAGSFINVIVYRLPRGQSIITPPSRCPACQTRLTWRENFPVLGWLWLRGRCRFCKGAISPEYPAIELFVGLLMAGAYVLYFMMPGDTGFLATRSPDWADAVWGTTIVHTWPTFAAHALLLAGLVAMTLVDARHYIIPLEIPWALTGVGIVANTLQPLTHRRFVDWAGFSDPGNWPVVPATSWTIFAVAVAGCVGIALAILLVEAGLLRRSFADYDEWEQAERKRLAAEKAGRAAEDATASSPSPPSTPPSAPEAAESASGETPPAAADVIVDPDDDFDISAYPHARREILREVLFLAPALAFMMLAYQLGTNLGWSGQPHPALMGLGGSLLGYLVGGGVVWGVRILGSLLFGKEAMGLGDVHMMAGVGAVLGWVDPTLTFFFAAPFLGIGYALISLGPGRLIGSLRKPIPYGPFLALGVVLILLFKPEYEMGLSRLLNTAINLP